MTTPDLAALWPLVEATSRLDAAIYSLKRENELHEDEIALHEALPVAQAALERMEQTSPAPHADETGHLHRCLSLLSTKPPRWACAAGCAVQRAEGAEARLARLTKALRRYGRHRANCGPVTPTTDLQALCTCGLDAILEGRDE